MNQLVIARFNEDLSWLEHVPDCFDIYIYNKGPDIRDHSVLDRAAAVITIPNIGRESETYLHHILLHRSVSNRYIVFTQGDPFEHSPDFLHLLGSSSEWQDIQPLSWRYTNDGIRPPEHLLKHDVGDHINGLRARRELFSLFTMLPIGFLDEPGRGIPLRYAALHRLPSGANIASHFFHSCDLASVAREADRHLIGSFSYGAIFAVKDHLISRLSTATLSRAWYFSTSHEIHGYVLERLWLHLFGLPFKCLSAT